MLRRLAGAADCRAGRAQPPKGGGAIRIFAGFGGDDQCALNPMPWTGHVNDAVSAPVENLNRQHPAQWRCLNRSDRVDSPWRRALPRIASRPFAAAPRRLRRVSGRSARRQSPPRHGPGCRRLTRRRLRRPIRSIGSRTTVVRDLPMAEGNPHNLATERGPRLFIRRSKRIPNRHEDARRTDRCQCWHNVARTLSTKFLACSLLSAPAGTR